ncbi:stretch-activated Ca2+-permeable channel component-domain-containing protein [Fusarium tricinctum]|uniref:Stretch-activated Ca2+-permeable channel component-domain-containing protein n=2 Tax=Fusarium tricinctum species complex TaxID=679429 RepID=A0A8K0WDX9_9HYPO|nr:stretch-activated Ca2+-permeable channel component-domain-containing protein [Fusarium tricinctum]
MIPNPPILRPSTSTIAYMLALVLSLLLCAPGYTEALQNSIFDLETLIDRSDTSGLLYEPNFAPFDRSIIGRAQADQPLLTNNGPDSRSIIPGGTVCYVVDKKTLFGDDKRDDDADGSTDIDMGSGHQIVRRAKTKTVYISANTCSRPTLKSKDKNGKFESTPQISLYTSTTSKVKCPTFGNYNKSNPDLKKIPFMEGAVTLTMNATDDIYISVVAPNLTQKYDGEWSYQVAISFDEYYHNYDAQNGTARLLLMDSDSTSALLVTSNLTQDSSKTQQIMKTPPPYQIFVGDEKSRSIDGLRHSSCGLTRSAEIWANGERTGRHNDMVTTGVTTRGPGKLPKQQFLIAGLNHSTTYSGILVKMPDKNSKRDTKSGQTIGGGGTIYRATTFQTSSSTNCKMVTNLDFCNETQYAVPGNDKKFNNTALAKHYDEYARKMYANFEKVIAQIPCEAPPESRYSLARTCDQCREAYKRWLCTVSIPRCEDVMGGGRHSVVRNAFQAFPNGTTLPDDFRKGLRSSANNSSRNAWIDKTVEPGPYKELLPCEDICYDVVQSCPAAIGFTCPQPGFPSFGVSYGQRDPETSGITCNYPGEARTRISAAEVLRPGTLVLSAVSLMIWLAL